VGIDKTYYKGERKLKKGVFFVMQLLLLWALNEVGNLFVGWTHLPIPGNVVGMVLLFILLMTGIVKLHWVDAGGSWLLKHLSFFFIPISVGLMTLGSTFIHSGIILLFILMLSGALGIIGTGISSQLLSKGKEEYHDHHHHAL